MDFAWGAIALLVTIMLAVSARETLRVPALLRKNYAQREVVTGAGVLAVFGFLLSAALLTLVNRNRAGWLFDTVMVVTGFSLVGLLDDVIGVSGPRGIRSHLRALAQGQFSSGLLKLILGISIAVVATITTESIVTQLLRVVVIAGAANVFNLLDLAPGRATKYAVVLFAPTLALERANLYFLVGPLMFTGAVLGLLYFEMREELMLGDAGANALGAAVGSAWVITVAGNDAALLGAAVVVVAINIAGEMVSFSGIIERVGPLRAFDRLGRRGVKRIRGPLVALVVLGLVVYAVARLLESNGPATAGPRSLDDIEVPSSGVVRWSPDSTKLAVVVAGELVVVRVADAKELGRAGGSIVDAAWMPDARRVVVVEGPIPTGQVVAVGVDGRGAGATPLVPSVAFGQGRGLGVDDRGTRVVAITTRREAVGGATAHDLAVVQLQTGEVRVFPTDGTEESSPVFLDAGTVAYAATQPGGSTRLATLDLETGESRLFGRIHVGPMGVLASGEVVVGRRSGSDRFRVDAVDSGGVVRLLGRLPSDARPVSVDRFGTRAVVRRGGGAEGTRLGIEALRT